MGMRLNLGNLAADAGDHAAARDAARSEPDDGRASQRLFRSAGWATLTLAELAIADGDVERAAELLDAALEHLRALGDRWGVARGLAARSSRR